MDSDGFVRVFEPMPGKDFLASTADELRFLARQGLALDGSNHVYKGLPEVATIEAKSPWAGTISRSIFGAAANLSIDVNKRLALIFHTRHHAL